MTKSIAATTLRPGAVYGVPAWYGGSTRARFPLIRITVLREPEPAVDFFGRHDHIKVWARREDTGAEGFMTYGPDAEVDLLDPGSELEAA